MGDKQGVVDLARQQKASSHYSVNPIFRMVNGLWKTSGFPGVQAEKTTEQRKLIAVPEAKVQKPKCLEGSPRASLWHFCKRSVLPADDVVQAPGKLHSDPKVQLWARLQQSQDMLGESGAQDGAANRRVVSWNHKRQECQTFLPNPNSRWESIQIHSSSQPDTSS